MRYEATLDHFGEAGALPLQRPAPAVKQRLGGVHLGLARLDVALLLLEQALGDGDELPVLHLRHLHAGQPGRRRVEVAMPHTQYSRIRGDRYPAKLGKARAKAVRGENWPPHGAWRHTPRHNPVKRAGVIHRRVGPRPVGRWANEQLLTTRR
jgi:hypothetical protein